MATIAVTGASGKLGSATIRILLERKVAPANIIAIVRDPAKVMALAALGVEIRRGDYTDPASLENALRGIDRLAFISSSALGEERVLHHGNVVKAAKLARVGHIFYTSVIKPAAQAKFAASPGHLFTEELIAESGLAHTFLRNNLYMDLVPIMFGGALATGTLAHNGGDGRIGFIARQDIAAALAAVLTSEGHAGHAYSITAPMPYGLGDIAAALGKASGTRVAYEPLTSDEFRTRLSATPIPTAIVEMTVALGEAIRAGEFDAESDDCARLLGREPTTLHAFLANARAAK